MKIKRKKRKWNPNEKSGIANEAIPVMATIIINIGLTILALTAACPKTNAPTIPMVGPIGDGTLKPASLINSKDISITIISKITGKTIQVSDILELNKYIEETENNSKLYVTLDEDNSNNIKYIDSYIKDYCAYGTRYFLLKKIK